ncbi:acid phosphatase [Vibrio pectenicida]|uniref:Acid phosphatase n=1 Tax=Vibrio pectenicida TaxID=62763 RepID=A0A3R9F7U0_9VIBR|nr:phosphatase PAP2 family protein [Vibrio pectenicida]RSD30870.1 phosphatase PAP2 family protein [Vibrio pectenicida]
MIRTLAAITSILWSSYIFAATNDEIVNFLSVHEVPDSLSILPPPPTENTVQWNADKQAFIQTRHFEGTRRWKLAIADANLSANHMGDAFSDVLGIDISPRTTPKLIEVLKRVRGDSARLAVRSAKLEYMRIRPFVQFNTHSCTPESEKALSGNGSYPSGHASYGWAAALVLAELVPEKQNALFARGYDFGQSRVVCGVHWQSDVDAGRLMGSAAYARLHAKPEFISALAEASKELQELGVLKK